MQQIRSQVNEQIALAQERVEVQIAPAHARLIWAGLRTNELARRALALAATFDPNRPLPFLSLCHLLGLGANRFRVLYNSLVMCGAFVPMPLDPSSEQLLHALCEHGDELLAQPDPVAVVVSTWRGDHGDTLNPALAALLREEMNAA